MTEWILRNKKADFPALEQETGLSGTMCRVLANRGLTDTEKARAYLQPQTQPLYPAALLKNADRAGELLLMAVREKRHIRIIGDYDVDGVMATYLLYQALRTLGASVDYRIPDRIRDGYGMNMKMVEEAEQDQVALLLTCDNGIAAAEPVARAKESGMQVIVTDHHDIPCHKEDGVLCHELPPADVIVNPKQPGETYPQSGICGAMVAYKVVCLLFEAAEKEGFFCDRGRKEEVLSELLVPVAFATVCDVMELTGENRAAVAKGLSLAKTCQNHGIRALLAAYGLMERSISAYHAGFLIGPCFNAAGRLDTALLGLELLLCGDAAEAEKRAERLKELNDVRKQMTLEATKAAQKLAEEALAENPAQVLVLYLPECHESLAGIVAGRIREQFYLPVIILTKGESCIKGSGRSIEGYPMFERLSEQKDLFLAFGGHPMAAGMSLDEKNAALLGKRLNEAAQLTEEILTRRLYLDAVLPFSEISEELLAELERLEPFGNGNPKPLFAASGVQVSSMQRIGREGDSLRLRLTDAAGTTLTGLYFHGADAFEEYLVKEFGAETVRGVYRGTASVALTLAFSPAIDEYQGKKYPQIIIQEYKRTK